MTAVSAGTAIILLSCEGHVAAATIVVHGSPPAGPPVASIAVSPTARSLGAGEVAGLIATLRDAAGNPLLGRSLTWTTSASAIATVSSGGYLDRNSRLRHCEHHRNEWWGRRVGDNHGDVGSAVDSDRTDRLQSLHGERGPRAASCWRTPTVPANGF